MKRFPSGFYKSLAALRATVGNTEYNRDTALRPRVVDLIKTYEHTESELYTDLADSILDNAERVDVKSTQGFLPFDEHLPLSRKQRIKRGAMELPHIRRRERVIDRNKAAQDTAWAREKALNAVAIDQLEAMPVGTRIDEVLLPDGKPKIMAA